MVIKLHYYKASKRKFKNVKIMDRDILLLLSQIIEIWKVVLGNFFLVVRQILIQDVL